MGVIIDDFEVVVEAPPAPAAGGGAAAPADKPPGPTPEDVRTILDLRCEREARVCAH